MVGGTGFEPVTFSIDALLQKGGSRLPPFLA